MQNDLETLGYVLEFGKVDTQNYLLPQRRNRIYATADVSMGQNVESYAKAMQTTMDDLSSDALIDVKLIFDDTLPKSWLTTERQTSKLKEALEAACLHEGSQNVFIDGSTSNGRTAEYAVNVLTCVRPSHQIYSQRLQRWVAVEEMWLAQGLFPKNFENPHAVEAVLENQSLAQDLAGNAFSSTCMQAKLVASLIHSEGWESIASQTSAAVACCDSGDFSRRSSKDSFEKRTSDGGDGAMDRAVAVQSNSSGSVSRKRSIADISSDDAQPVLQPIPVVKRARGKTKPQNVGPDAATSCMVEFKKDGMTHRESKRGLEVIRKRNAEKKQPEPIDDDDDEPRKKRKYETSGKTARDGKGTVVSIWKKLQLLNATWYLIMYIYIYSFVFFRCVTVAR